MVVTGSQDHSLSRALPIGSGDGAGAGSGRNIDPIALHPSQIVVYGEWHLLRPGRVGMVY